MIINQVYNMLFSLFYNFFRNSINNKDTFYFSPKKPSTCIYWFLSIFLFIVYDACTCTLIYINWNNM